jgi:hypothetical protein
MLMRFLGDREQDPTPYQLVFEMNVNPGEMTMAAGRIKPAKVTRARTERDSGMIGMAATDIVQEAQSEVEAAVTMRIEAGSQGMRYRGKF